MTNHQCRRLLLAVVAEDEAAGAITAEEARALRRQLGGRGSGGWKRRLWSAEEDEMLRTRSDRSCEQIARELGRTVGSVYGRRRVLRLPARHGGGGYHYHGPELLDFVREKHGLGWSDAEIAAAWSNRCGWTVNRRTIGDRRQKLGLPHNAFSERQRRRVAAKTAAQLRKAGLGSMAELRLLAWAKQAGALGWPDWVRPRELQVLQALWERGPQTKNQIARAIGMPVKASSAKTLVGNGPGGSYVATLMRAKLVCSLRKAVAGDNGTKVDLYFLAPGVRPKRRADLPIRPQ